MMALNCSRGALLAAAALFGLHTPAAAQENDTIDYTIRQGDTLIGLASKYFTNTSVIGQVMVLNQIRDPRRLPIGKVLKLPRDILKSKPEPVRVLHVSGDVTVNRNGSSVSAKQNDTIGAGAVITTGAREFITLGGTGASKISLPSNSSIRIRGAKRYIINEAIDFDVQVLRGRSAIEAPKLKRDERYNVSTPRAVTAVRGTKFRVAFDEAKETSLTEVTEGVVSVASAGSETSLPEKFGISAFLQGLGETEALLSAPKLIDPAKTQTGEKVTFQIQPLDNAKAYRTQIARDQSFIEIIAEGVSEDLEITFDDLPDGRLRVRSRAIAESGLEGLPIEDGFRRKRVGAAAGIEESPFADAFKFVWLSEGEGNSFGAFQLWNVETPEVLVVDEVGLQSNGLYVSNLKPGKYAWRQATFQILKEEMVNGELKPSEIIKVWTPALTFDVDE
ncbi:FecR domain-containing protein [Erythrobacter sp. F6033]|uniref:FecR domain-containing protein n=1 Tax=Erythrobacter sp. F6033 TaxID=2926401 RepID=UPI001FF36B28|nr:FecR domain-containing protein [Erythrobacter sp. F6033]MCK0127649.1 FecR domain-containing protein [Erythrobacter sp. F6033]